LESAAAKEAAVRDCADATIIAPSVMTFKYNAGANPIAFTVSKQHLTHSKIIDILKQAYELA